MLLPKGQFLPAARWRDADSETMQQVAHLIQPEATGLRETKDRKPLNGVGRVAPLPIEPYRFGKHTDPLPISNRGSRRTAFRGQFTYRDLSVSLR